MLAIELSFGKKPQAINAGRFFLRHQKLNFFRAVLIRLLHQFYKSNMTEQNRATFAMIKSMHVDQHSATIHRSPHNRSQNIFSKTFNDQRQVAHGTRSA